MNKIITGVLVGMMILGGAASAQAADLPLPGITPGSPFFFLDRFFEGLGNILTFGQAAKAQRAVAIAEERLSEARTLADRGNENAQRAIGLYEEKIAEAAERAQRARNTGALVHVTEATSKHFAVLEDVMERVPEQARASVQRALQSSNQGQISALQALKNEDPSQAVEAGLAAIKAHAERARVNTERGKPENAEQAANDFQEVLATVSDAPRGNTILAARFSEQLTEVIEGLDRVKDAASDIPESVKDKINQTKGLSIDAQIASLRELAREYPEKAIDIFAAAAEARLNAVKRGADEEDGDGTEESLGDYERYAQFGQEISTLAEGIRTGETAIEDLVKRATSHHLQVLEKIQQKLPVQAQQEFQRAKEASQKIQELRPIIPAPPQPGISPPAQQAPAIGEEQKPPEVKREEIEPPLPGGPPQEIPRR